MGRPTRPIFDAGTPLKQLGSARVVGLFWFFSACAHGAVAVLSVGTLLRLSDLHERFSSDVPLTPATETALLLAFTVFGVSMAVLHCLLARWLVRNDPRRRDVLAIAAVSVVLSPGVWLLSAATFFVVLRAQWTVRRGLAASTVG